MNKVDKLLEDRFEQYSSQIDKWREEFIKFEESVSAYILEPATKRNLDNIQQLIDNFLQVNNIPIKINSYLKSDNSIVMIGSTLIDHIIWESLQM